MAYNSSTKVYCCVRFLEGDGSIRRTVIPRCWVKESYMYWSDSLNATKQWDACCLPDKTWPRYEVLDVLVEGGMNLEKNIIFYLFNNSTLKYITINLIFFFLQKLIFVML